MKTPIDEGSLSPNRLQYSLSAAPVQTVGTILSSSAGGDSQVPTKRGIFPDKYIIIAMYDYLNN